MVNVFLKTMANFQHYIYLRVPPSSSSSSTNIPTISIDQYRFNDDDDNEQNDDQNSIQQNNYLTVPSPINYYYNSLNTNSNYENAFFLSRRLRKHLQQRQQPRKPRPPLIFRPLTTTMSKENNNETDDVAKDPGSMSNRPTSETDVEGHRVFHGYGVHVPGSGTRRRPGSGGGGGSNGNNGNGHRRNRKNGSSKRSKDSEDESDSELMRPCMYLVFDF